MGSQCMHALDGEWRSIDQAAEGLPNLAHAHALPALARYGECETAPSAQKNLRIQFAMLLFW